MDLPLKLSDSRQRDMSTNKYKSLLSDCWEKWQSCNRYVQFFQQISMWFMHNLQSHQIQDFETQISLRGHLPGEIPHLRGHSILVPSQYFLLCLISFKKTLVSS